MTDGSSVRPGDRAPHFCLSGVGTDGATVEVSSEDLRGRPAVLVFYPADNSPVCTRQLESYSVEFDRFATLDAQVLGISPQDVASHRQFAASRDGFAFPLLSDIDKTVGDAFAILGPVGFYKRSVFVLDADGVVRYAHRATAGLTFRPVDELVEAIEAID
ncbi:MAG: peroxiredoxin [Acidimicrobiales bacterium]